MGNCCAAKTKQQNVQLEAMKVQRANKFEQMTIFQAPSAIIKTNAEDRKFQSVTEKPKNTIKKMSDATSAIRESYIATNQILGEGAYGKVFLFKSKAAGDDKHYAVKVLLKELMPERAVEQIREENTVLSMMDHPNIIKYVESFEDNRYMYIVTEYVESSRDLTDIMTEAFETWDKKTPFFPVDDVRKLMKMVLSGVAHMHANQIVHRDLKPGNCLLDDKFGLNIIDFGLALDHSEKPKTNSKNYILGTTTYMAPEIFQNEGSFDSYK